MRKSVASLVLLLGLGGCLGYHVGPIKPNYLSDIHILFVPIFKNSTIIPRVEELVTDSVIKQLQQDGSYKIGTESHSDATLEGEITRIARSPARSVRGNVLATSEFNLSIHVRYRVMGRDGNQIGPQGEAAGTTNFFVGTDVTTDERQALPLASEELATRLVSQLSEGW